MPSTTSLSCSPFPVTHTHQDGNKSSGRSNFSSASSGGNLGFPVAAAVAWEETRRSHIFSIIFKGKFPHGGPWPTTDLSQRNPCVSCTARPRYWRQPVMAINVMQTPRSPWGITAYGFHCTTNSFCHWSVQHFKLQTFDSLLVHEVLLLPGRSTRYPQSLAVFLHHQSPRPFQGAPFLPSRL